MVSVKRKIRSIWMLSREYEGLAGAGGVKDVVSQLSKALAKWTGRSVNVVLPCYGFIDPEKNGFTPLVDPCNHELRLRFKVAMNYPGENRLEEVSCYVKKVNRVRIYLLEADRFGEKGAVYTYTADEQKRVPWQREASAHHDYFAMNLLLQKATLELIILLEAKPDIIHCHDGHTAVLPALVREYAGYRSYFRNCGCLVTIHNAGRGYHQEVADLPYAESITALPGHIIKGHLLEYKFDPFLLAGSYSVLNTVSENYARELQHTEDDELTGWLGHQLYSKDKIIEGVTNGIDPKIFDPTDHPLGPSFSFDPGDTGDALEGKVNCKVAFLEKVNNGGLSNITQQYGYLGVDPHSILLSFIGRLNEQKGVDILIEVLKALMVKITHIQVVIVGNGDLEIEERLKFFCTEDQFKGRVCYYKGYDPELASEVYRAGDFFVIPSRFEPCGLTDFIAQLYGNIPIVHNVGGLVKVKDGFSGLAYNGNSPDGLLAALRRGVELYRDKVKMRQIQLQAVREIKEKYTWSEVMQNYLELYKKATPVVDE